MDSSRVLVRYRYPDGRLQAALPMHVVDERPDLVVGWLPSGTEISYWATEEGEDPRTVPLDQRFCRRLGSARRRWQGMGVLRVISVDQCWQVVHFWHPDTGDFLGWYVNLESPKHRRGSALDAVDWYLDLVISPELVATWKDEDEAAAAVGTRYLRRQDLAEARRVGEAIAADPQALIDRIGDWREFRPPTAWAEALDLPDGWDRDVA